jgi:O-succinylbenzoic acid--CoA ligase
MTPLELLRQQRYRPWLVGVDAVAFWRRWQQRCGELEQLLRLEPNPHILLVTADPLEALASFFAACCYPVHLWLGNPNWALGEWQQALPQMGPVHRWGDIPVPLLPFQEPPNWEPLPSIDSARIWIPTGGSSGNLRFAGHTWATLTAAVRGFCQHFQQPTVSAYCVLPLYHVSGLMQALRCLMTGGTLWVQSFKALTRQGPLPGQPAFLSLVPTQLHRLLRLEREPWLRSHQAILLGGAPAWPTLLARSRQAALPLAPTYGMTETAAQVATLLPREFLAGNTSSGRALPHCTLTIQNETGACSTAGPARVDHLSRGIPGGCLSTGGDRGPLSTRRSRLFGCRWLSLRPWSCWPPDHHGGRKGAAGGSGGGHFSDGTGVGCDRGGHSRR